MVKENRCQKNGDRGEMNETSGKTRLFEGFFGQTGKEVEETLFSNNDEEKEGEEDERWAQSITPFQNNQSDKERPKEDPVSFKKGIDPNSVEHLRLPPDA